jgi:hypothetical protein
MKMFMVADYHHHQQQQLLLQTCLRTNLIGHPTFLRSAKFKLHDSLACPIISHSQVIRPLDFVFFLRNQIFKLGASHISVFVIVKAA